MHRSKTEQVIIYPSRLRLLWAFLGSTTFVAIIACLLRQGELPPFITVVCWIGLLFFGFGVFACGFMLARNLYNRHPQLRLDPAGITFLDGDGTPHHIVWGQVERFRTLTVAGQKFILIDVLNPAALIDAEPSAVRRKLMEYNLKQYGAPFNIAPDNLNIPKGTLLPLLREFHEKYRPHGSA